MKKFYFTFGTGHFNGDKYQVIFAENEEEARGKMFEMHGKQWAFSYPAAQWQESKAKGFFKNLAALGNEYSFAS